MEIKAQDVKTLREKTGAGMMDCKKALVEAGGDFAKAERILKELGLAAAQKRLGRTTNEGRIFTRILPERAVMLELSCETDFVSRNQEFLALGDRLCDVVLEKQGEERQQEIDARVAETVGKIKENIGLRRYHVFGIGPDQLLRAYLHGEGRIGVVVKLALSDPALKNSPKVQEAAFDVALHVAAFAPQFLSRQDVSPEYVREQEEIFTKQAQGLGKPENVAAGIAKGKLNKHLSEVTLLDQPYVKDQNLTVAKVIDQVGKEAGGKVQVAEYRYYRVGDEQA